MLEAAQSGPGCWNIHLTQGLDYQMLLADGALHRVGTALTPLLARLGATECVIVSEPRCAQYHLAKVTASLEASQIRHRVLMVATGEQAKSLHSATGLWERLNAGGAHRRTILLALGGGAVCDLVGFIAGTFMRGLPYVNLPTSLIAQLDGAVGGKVGIDFDGAKNLIGMFHHPCLVLIDPLALTTLTERDLRSGLAEAVKVAVIRSEELFARLESWRISDYPSEPARAALREIIAAAIRIKLELLADDPFEYNLNRLLNFGHTIGHALEAASGLGTYRHGESVAIGMAAMTRLAARLGVGDSQAHGRILRLLRALELGTEVPPQLVAATLSQLDTIARVRNGHLRVVLPERIGSCSIHRSPPISPLDLCPNATGRLGSARTLSRS